MRLGRSAAESGVVPPAPVARGGVVSLRRSAADGRDTYYVLELERCRDLLSSAGVSLHPGLAPTLSVGGRSGRGVASARVLFLCTGNSGRSQIAEAVATQLSEGAVVAASAGSRRSSWSSPSGQEAVGIASPDSSVIMTRAKIWSGKLSGSRDRDLAIDHSGPAVAIATTLDRAGGEADLLPELEQGRCGVAQKQSQQRVVGAVEFNAGRHARSLRCMIHRETDQLFSSPVAMLRPEGITLLGRLISTRPASPAAAEPGRT